MKNRLECMGMNYKEWDIGKQVDELSTDKAGYLVYKPGRIEFSYKKNWKTTAKLRNFLLSHPFVESVIDLEDEDGMTKVSLFLKMEAEIPEGVITNTRRLISETAQNEVHYQVAQYYNEQFQAFCSKFEDWALGEISNIA